MRDSKGKLVRRFIPASASALFFFIVCPCLFAQPTTSSPSVLWLTAYTGMENRFNLAAEARTSSALTLREAPEWARLSDNLLTLSPHYSSHGRYVLVAQNQDVTFHFVITVRPPPDREIPIAFSSSSQAQLELLVTREARVFIDGVRTNQEGELREYEMPLRNDRAITLRIEHTTESGETRIREGSLTLTAGRLVRRTLEDIPLRH